MPAHCAALCCTVRGAGYNTDGSLARLQLIANECYSTQVRAIIVAPSYTENPYRAALFFFLTPISRAPQGLVLLGEGL